eukprot:2951658-Pyramimonas_sp.AAC.1
MSGSNSVVRRRRPPLSDCALRQLEGATLGDPSLSTEPDFYVSQECWRANRSSIYFQTCAEEDMRPLFRSSVAFWLNPKPVLFVSAGCSTWARGVEQSILEHRGMGQRSGPSRGTGCSFVFEEVRRSTKSRQAPLRDQAVCWWKRVATFLGRAL